MTMTKNGYLKVKKLVKEVLAEEDTSNLKFKLKKQIQDKFGVTPMVTIFDPYVAKSLKGKAGGKIEFKSKEFPDKTWSEMLNFLQSEGYEITNESNTYEVEDDRFIYPKIKFNFNI